MMSTRIKQAKRRHIVELLVVMTVYLAVVAAAKTLSRHVGDGPLLVLIALAPAIPMVIACYVFYRFYQRMDERQQRISANAAAVTLIVAIGAACVLGFLKSFGVYSHNDDFLWFTPFLIIVWALARRFMGDDC